MNTNLWHPLTIALAPIAMHGGPTSPFEWLLTVVMIVLGCALLLLPPGLLFAAWHYRSRSRSSAALYLGLGMVLVIIFFFPQVFLGIIEQLVPR